MIAQCTMTSSSTSTTIMWDLSLQSLQPPGTRAAALDGHHHQRRPRLSDVKGLPSVSRNRLGNGRDCFSLLHPTGYRRTGSRTKPSTCPWEPLVAVAPQTKTRASGVAGSGFNTRGMMKAMMMHPKDTSAAAEAVSAVATSALAQPSQYPAEAALATGDSTSSSSSSSMSSSVQEESGSSEGKGEKFRWEKHWYPVSLVEDLDSSRPTAIQLLGLDMVVWWDESGTTTNNSDYNDVSSSRSAAESRAAASSINSSNHTASGSSDNQVSGEASSRMRGRWVVMSDVCPHRLAPLSEGRLDEQGLLQCSYHGWSFRADGSCARIPQAAATGHEAKACSSKRACVAVYPSQVSQGLLFVWPEVGNFQEAFSHEPVKLPPQFDSPEFSSVTIQRDLFYGYDTLMENVSDPSHIDFAHHKVTGRRERAQPLPFTVAASGAWGFEGQSDSQPKISSTFAAPVAFFSRLDLNPVLPLLGQQQWELWICSFNVPLAPGKTRSIVCSARNFARFSLEWMPRWMEHLTSNKIYDGDMIVLQGQEKTFLSAAGGDDVAAQNEYGRLTYTPTGADRLVLAFRNWLRRYGGGQPAWQNVCSAQQQGVKLPPPSTTLSKREMLDRLGQHTEHCASCKAAYRNTQQLSLAFAALATCLLAAAAVPPEISLRILLAAAAIVCAGAAAALKLWLEPQFVFVDYVHADIK